MTAFAVICALILGSLVGWMARVEVEQEQDKQRRLRRVREAAESSARNRRIRDESHKRGQ